MKEEEERHCPKVRARGKAPAVYDGKRAKRVPLPA